MKKSLKINIEIICYLEKIKEKKKAMKIVQEIRYIVY